MVLEGKISLKQEYRQECADGFDKVIPSDAVSDTTSSVCNDDVEYWLSSRCLLGVFQILVLFFPCSEYI